MPALDNVSPLIVFEAKVTFAPLATLTYPPFSLISVAVPPLSMSSQPSELTVVLFATPPLEMYMEPLKLTVVLFADPPLSMYMLPPELTVVLFADPPLVMYMMLSERVMPVEMTPLEM
jgi:hypothetical protein